jgi:hypothetical protein
VFVLQVIGISPGGFEDLRTVCENRSLTPIQFSALPEVRIKNQHRSGYLESQAKVRDVPLQRKGKAHFRQKVLWSAIAYNIRVMTTAVIASFPYKFCETFLCVCV